jgi:hypothetical protein
MADTLTKDDIEIRPQEIYGTWAPTEPDEVAHIVNQREHNLAEAYILGLKVRALCGYEWIPTKSPDKLPVCGECKRIFAQQGGSVAS